MDAQLFKRLVDCNAEQSWEHVRDIVGVQLMGANVFPIPLLKDAKNFDIGHVILKGRRTTVEKLTGVWSSALPVGHLSKFVENEDNLVQSLANVKKDKTSDLNQAYEFHESDMRHGVKKTITVQLWGCEKWALDYVPTPGDLVVNLLKKGYVNMDRIFLITEVHYVSEVKVNIVIGDNTDEYQLRGRIPIGFSLVRYKLGPNGVLGDRKNVKVSKWKAHWIRHQFRDKDDPLPFDPFNKGTRL